MKKYQQAMRRLELTEMHERILTHLVRSGRTLSVAACLVVLLAGVLRFPGCFPAIRQIPPTY